VARDQPTEVPAAVDPAPREPLTLQLLVRDVAVLAHRQRPHSSLRILSHEARDEPNST
jgi:hypothetical protein